MKKFFGTSLEMATRLVILVGGIHFSIISLSIILGASLGRSTGSELENLIGAYLRIMDSSSAALFTAYISIPVSLFWFFVKLGWIENLTKFMKKIW